MYGNYIDFLESLPPDMQVPLLHIRRLNRYDRGAISGEYTIGLSSKGME